ncbi:uncharacterized protein [Panulirus ornatus]|uniref:uncharacterized protein isoform X3 n=1 Tax=Panulirus ornatus TaxID=150431 RepID=UPI003A862335
MEAGDGKKDPGRIKSTKNKLEDGAEREQGPKRKKMDGNDGAQAESTDPDASAIHSSVSELQEEIDNNQTLREQQYISQNTGASLTEKKAVEQSKKKMGGKDEAQAKFTDPGTSPIQPSSQLQEEIDTKQLTSQAEQFKNNTLKEQESTSQNTSPSSTEKDAIEQYKKKVQEFQSALSQRDHLIGQLQSRLAEYVQQQDELQAENLQQTETFTSEIETLKLQLKETTDSLSNKNWLSGVNPREHLQLKNKLISIQQDRQQDQEMIEQLTMQLTHKDEKYIQLEYRYKHCLQKLKQAQVDFEKVNSELKTSKTLVERLQVEGNDFRTKIQVLKDSHIVDIEKFTCQWSDEKKILEKQNKSIEEQREKLEEEIKTLHERMKETEALADSKLKEVKDETDRIIQKEQMTKEKASQEIQNLMQQLQELTTELAHTKEQHQAQLTAVEEQFGEHITLMKQQMSDSHNEELSRVKASHESELAQFTEQIDALEKAQKEDHAQFENLISVSNLNISLKEQLEKQREKIQTLEHSIAAAMKKNEELRERNSDLDLRLKKELDTRDDFEQKFEEQVRKNKEEESAAEDLKKEIVRLNETLKLEVEKRFSVENKLTMELQNMKELSAEKKSLEEKLENISNQISVMSNELAQSKTSKEELNFQFQKAQQRYKEVLSEVDTSKKIIQELEFACGEHQKEKQIWITEREFLVGELKDWIKILKEKTVDFERETKTNSDLSKEISLLKKDKLELSMRCDELAHYEQQCKTLTEELALRHSDIKKSKDEHDKVDELREKYIALFELYNSRESKRKEMEEECEQKCESLNDILQSLDSKLAAACSLSGKYQETDDHNTSLEKKFQIVICKLKEAEENISRLEEALMKADFDKEALVSELEQTKIARDSMEKEKNECETERDRMLEQYRMMKAELASTLLALDREVQLSTHWRLTSDIGISVSDSTSLEQNANQKETNVSINVQHPGGLAEKDVVTTEEGSVATKSKVNPQVNGEKCDKVWEDKISNLEKKNKELLNEIEKLKTKVHHQNISIESLENERSALQRRLSELEVEKVNFRADQEKYQKGMCEKMELHQQLGEVKLRIHFTEDNLKRQEKEMDHLTKSLKAIIKREGSGSPEKLKEIFSAIETSATKFKSGKNLDCTDYLRTYLSNQSEKLQCMCEELKKYLCKFLELLQHSDKLHEEKLKIELENLSLKVEVQKLTYIQRNSEHIDTKSVKTDHIANEVEKKSEGANEECALQKELRMCRHENEILRLNMEKNRILLRLENLHVQSSRLNSQKEVDLAMEEREMITAYVGKALEKLIEDWEDQAVTEPALVDFVSAQSCKVYDVIRELSASGELPGSKAHLEAALRLIRQAVVKNVSGQYLQVVKDLLTKLDQDITNSIHVTLPKVLLDTSQDSALSEGSADEVKKITDKVEHLINVRTTLVDAANDIEEQLEEAVASRMSCIKSEIDTLIKETSSALAAKENELNTKTTTPGDLNTLLESHQHFIDEFLEVTTNIYQEAQSEKLQILKSQMTMVHKILEDNKAKLHTVCERYLEDLKKVDILSDSIKQSNDMVASLERTLSEEVAWVEQQYKELLEQYSYEQNLHMQSHSLTLEELKNRLISLLKSTSVETELNEIKACHKSEIASLKEEHAVDIQRLENQLQARDQETLLEDENDKLHKIIEPATDVNSLLFQRHLQSLYSDRDWYKKTVGLLSHVTLQLLHYYSVAETYTHKSQDHKVYNENTEDHGVIHQPEMSSGKVLDLSFLSDYMPEDNEASQLNMFTEDSALSTGLMGKTVYPDPNEDTELTSNSGSVLDSTAMSEGMLDDVDKDEQVRSILTKSYPQLMSILKGRWDRVVVENLEKEVQELTISLQASAGMLKIFMHSAFSEKQELSSHTLRGEMEGDSMRETNSDFSQPHLSETSQSHDHHSHEKEKDMPHPIRSLDEVQSGCFGDRKKSTKSTIDIPPLEEGDANMENQSSHSHLFKQLTHQDLDDFSENLSHLLNQDDSFINFTSLKHQDLRDGDKLKAAIKQLFLDAQATESLQLKLHHIQGLLKGLEDEKKTLRDEIDHLNHLAKNLALELQVAKDQIEELELTQQGRVGGTPTQYAARMEASKDIRERVRATLSAKDKSLMDHADLVARVGDLERMLEALVSDNDAIVEALKNQVSDLSQQLEAADRQLRSSRQFLEEHATERDQEMEDLVHTKDKLTSQLREKEAFITLHANMEKEVENLERQLREKSQELQDTLSSKEEIQVELKAAVDKIWDLREIIRSLEAQVDGKCAEESELSTQIESLKAALAQSDQLSKDLAAQLEQLRYEGGENSSGYNREYIPTQAPHIDESEEEKTAQLAGSSLYVELNDEFGQATPDATSQILLQGIEKRLECITRGLEALQLSISSVSHSAEDISIQENLEMPAVQELEPNRTLSPSTINHRLEDKLLTLECTAEAAVKHTRDLEMTLKNLRLDYEEVAAERDVLQERLREQLVLTSSLEARLDEMRRSDHPMTAELRQRLTVVQDDLEKKRNELTKKGREVEELKHSLSNTRGKLMSREEELKRMQSMSQPHSLPQTASDQLLIKHRQLEEDVEAKDKLIKCLKKDLIDASKSDIIPTSLAQSLIEDKNAEIHEKTQELLRIRSRISEVITFIIRGGSLLDTQKMLQNLIGRKDKFSDRLAENEAFEVLRKSSVQQSEFTSNTTSGLKEGVSPLTVSSGRSDYGSDAARSSTGDFTLMSIQPDAPIELSKVSHVSEDGKAEGSSVFEGNDINASKKEDKEMNEEVSAALHTSSFEEEILITKEEYENLCSASDEVTVLRVQIELLQKEISSLNKYQGRLEEDFKAAQEMLESREAEINQLSEEIEDSVPLPLPSETLQMQERCVRLEEQVMELQEKLNEAATINREYEKEMDKLTLRTQQADQEIQELRECIDTLREKVKQAEDLLNKKETVLKETRCQIEKDYKQNGQREVELCSEFRVLHEQLEKLKQEHVDQSATLQRKNEEIAQLSTQLNMMRSEMKQRLSHTSREAAQLEQQYQKEISDMKEEHILREKQLCSDYEERMAAQVSDLSVKLGKEKEEAIARQQHFYESALRESSKEKERIQKELQKQLLAVDLCNRSQQTSELCASVDELNAGVKHELDKSGQLDNSLVSFVKHGHSRGDPDFSTRASSAVSDLSDGDEPSDVANKVQKLMNKIHEQGIEMLTLIELMFLQKHHTHLDIDQRSLISCSGFIATGSTDSSIADVQSRPSQYGQNGMENLVTTGERTQLLRHMATLEEELSRKDKEMKRKVDLLEFRLEQEKMSGNEWKLSFEGEKKRGKELMDQLRQEKLAGVDQVSELTLLRSHLFIMQLQLQKTQEENGNMNETLENNKKELETLKGALQAERNNFSRVSKVLNQQRHLSAVTRAQQDNVIKDLRSTLDKEREKIMVLCSQLAEATNQQSAKKSNRISIPTRRVESERITSGLLKDNSTTGKQSLEDFQVQLAVEQERYTELQRLYERERLKVVSLNEQTHAERAHAKVELMEEQEKCAELTKTIWNMEVEKETLMRQMSQDREHLLHHESRVRELEGKVQKLEGDLRAQADAHQVVSHRVREEDAQLHVSYTRTLNKLGEAEAELCSLRHKIRTATKELELAREREEQLQKELNTEKMAINRLGLPALARINNLDEYFELQLKENLELCKSVLRLTDDRQLTRKKIINLENTITNLTEQLVEAKSAAADNPDIEKLLQTERSIWEGERLSLQRIISQREVELTRLQAEAGSRTIQNVRSAQLDDERAQYIYGKYIQSEHWRKALVWQKQYLLGVINGYRDNEQNALSRLHNIASQVHGSVRSEDVQTSDSAIHPKHRFRVGVLVVIVICRMKTLVQKYRRKRRLGTQMLFPSPQAASSNLTSATEASESSRPGSSSSVIGAASAGLGEMRPLRSFDRGAVGGILNTFTGQTPPTKGPSDASTPHRSGPSSSCRSLFIDEESPRLNEYIERLDNIHSALGLNPRNT